MPSNHNKHLGLNYFDKHNKSEGELRLVYRYLLVLVLESLSQSESEFVFVLEFLFESGFVLVFELVSLCL